MGTGGEPFAHITRATAAKQPGVWRSRPERPDLARGPPFHPGAAPAPGGSSPRSVTSAFEVGLLLVRDVLAEFAQERLSLLGFVLFSHVHSLDLLRRLGCFTGQGYLLARPVPADMIGELIIF